MSRIDEALQQAGLKPPRTAAQETGSALDAFARSSEEQDLPEPTRRVPPAQAVTPHRSEARHGFAVTEKLVMHEATGPGCVEQYRRVAATLHQLQGEHALKSLMVASAEVGEGKTLTAANLALTLSESYQRRVLLIDADLRRPSLSSLFRIQQVSGLSESLSASTPGPLRVLELSANLSLLPSGRPNSDPMAGLTSGRMLSILEQAARDYDWTILDTPPVSLQSDAHLVSAMVDGVVFVIGAGVAQYPVIQRSIEMLGREKIVGIVLNRVDPSLINETAYVDYYYNRPDQRAGVAQTDTSRVSPLR